jgi:Ca2+-binding EF-hand superfamily protein
MSWLKNLGKQIKKGTKLIVDNMEKEANPNEQELENRIKEKLDINKDGKLNFDDVTELVKGFFDVNNDGKIDFWEWIAAIFEIRRLVKKLK